MPLNPLKTLLLYHVDFWLTESVKSHSLVRPPNMRLSKFLLTPQSKASKCILEGQLEIEARERWIAKISHSEVQKKTIDQDFACWRSSKTSSRSVMRIRLSTTAGFCYVNRKFRPDHTQGRRPRNKNVSQSTQIVESHVVSSTSVPYCRFRTVVCHSCGKMPLRRS